MPEVSVPVKTPALQPCKSCGTQIPVGAKLCSVCKSYQNWLGSINNSALILSLLVALFSVLSTAVPAVRNALRPDRSDLRLKRFYYTESGVSLIVNNTGRMPGFVSSCKMQLANGSSSIWDFNFNLEKPSDTRVVKADTIVELFFKTDHGWMTDVLKEKVGPTWQALLNGGNLKAHLIVDLTQFDGSTDRRESVTPFKDFYYKY